MNNLRNGQNKIAAIKASETLNESLEKYKALVEPLKHLNDKISSIIPPIINSFINALSGIDWSSVDFLFKEIAVKYLKNGFYPYRNTNIKYEELLNTNSQAKEIKIIKEGIRRDIKKKKELLSAFSNHKKIINESFVLYKNKKYRLCILSLINTTSIICNAQFKHIDFTERKNMQKKLLEKEIIKEKEKNYLLFSPYITDDRALFEANNLLNNYQSTPELYSEIPYNRNAILHGHSKSFGNEINCLRWFSVLFNFLEITQELKEIINKKQQ